MAMTAAPSFHHADPSTPERSWNDHLHHEARVPLDLAGVQHLVVVAAHPDDETLMAGGLIATAHLAGIRISVVIATDGEGSHPGSPTHSPDDLVTLRRREVATALGVLAPAAVLHTLGLTDGDLAAGHDVLVRTLVDLIGMGGDSVLLVSTWRSDGHTDHEAAALAAASAAWRTDARFLEAPIWLWHWGTPGHPLPSGPALQLPTAVLGAKLAAMREHRSQTEPLSEHAGDEEILTPAMLSHFTRNTEVFFDGVPGETSPFEALHAGQADPWRVHSSFFEQRKRALTLATLTSPHYGRVVELGCSVGALAADLAARTSHLLAVDESASAVQRASAALAHLPHVEVVQMQVPEKLGILDADLVVISEIGYFLSPSRLRRLARAVRSSGCATVLACHWRHDIEGWPLDGQVVHRILREGLGAEPTVSVEDPDFVLELFTLDAMLT
ncbi:MAG: bifunctional PIG-L family deacetylase/class I SAM-dependent methyltransferase [Propionibacteriaceae bacterium]|nr:bifunctional PIG-L family deacetylase/class I SAM-dependent methyltransferase [Propionibacteriaceae bacterium]